MGEPSSTVELLPTVELPSTAELLTTAELPSTAELLATAESPFEGVPKRAGGVSDRVARLRAAG